MIGRGAGPGKSFRNRGVDVSRMEGFSDTVFGFALTLLIIQTQPQLTFADLTKIIHYLVVFLICFASLAYVWYSHYLFCRRYGLEDGWTILLNLALLFVILFYVYPLRFVYTLAVAPSLLPQDAITNSQVPALFVIYGLGFTAVFFILALLYMHAYRLRGTLDLSEVETYDTVTALIGTLVMVLTGLISVGIALVLHNPEAAGLWYGSLFFSRTLYGSIRGRGHRSLTRRLDQ
jgi:uncharacterized membrane protein